MNPLETYIKNHGQRFIEELITFCAQPSIANTGQGMQAMANLVETRLTHLGTAVESLTVPGSYPYLVAEVGDGPQTLLVYNHYDVQPAHAQDGWQSPPFKPTLRDGQLFARGVADNKANLLSRIQAVEAYQAIYGPLPCRVRFLLEGEEEIGSPHLGALVEAHPHLVKADGCIWEGGRKGYTGQPVLQLGLRGVLYLELSIQAPTREHHSSWANVTYNPAFVLLQTLQEVVNSLTDAFNRPKFGNLLKAATPPTPVDLAMLETIPFDIDHVQNKHHVALRPDLSGVEALRELLFEPSCTLCGLGVGYTQPGIKTAIPNRAFAKLDLRLPPGLTPDVAEEELRAYLQKTGQTDIEVKRLVALSPWQTPPDSHLINVVSEAVRATYQLEPIIYPLMPASGPMALLCQPHNLPVVTIGAGHADDRVHGVDENIYVADYLQAIACFVEILRQFGA